MPTNSQQWVQWQWDQLQQQWVQQQWEQQQQWGAAQQQPGLCMYNVPGTRAGAVVPAAAVGTATGANGSG